MQAKRWMGGLTPVAKQKRMLAEVSKRYGVTVGGRVCFRYSACWVSGQRLWGCSLCRGEVPGSYVGWLQRCGVAGLCGNVPAGRMSVAGGHQAVLRRSVLA